jgi:uncharacterized membrane protein
MEGIKKIDSQDLFEKAYAVEMFIFLMTRPGAVSDVYRSSIMDNLWRLKESQEISDEFYFKIFKAKNQDGK